jgi:hypothetical protein
VKIYFVPGGVDEMLEASYCCGVEMEVIRAGMMGSYDSDPVAPGVFVPFMAYWALVCEVCGSTEGTARALSSSLYVLPMTGTIGEGVVR